MAANIRLLQRRIKTAKNISQITRAMEMVSASKMRRGQERSVAGKPYTQKLQDLVQNLLGRIEGVSHPYLENREHGKTLLLVVSPDKGLCGSLNTNLLREYMRYRETHRDFDVIVMGKKMQKAVVRLEGKLIADFLFGSAIPNFDAVFPLSKIIVDGFLNKTYKNVDVMYTQFLSLGSQKPTVLPLLPVKKENTESESQSPYKFEPTAGELLEDLMPHYLEMTLFQILLECYASEHASRMLFMHQASENAKDVISELSLYYNKARQEKITNELLDIVGGSFGLQA